MVCLQAYSKNDFSNEINKYLLTVINWSRYKRYSPYQVIESIQVISLNKLIVLSFPSCKVDYKNKINKSSKKLKHNCIHK